MTIYISNNTICERFLKLVRIKDFSELFKYNAYYRSLLHTFNDWLESGNIG